jgi:hypothetical protein
LATPRPKNKRPKQANRTLLSKNTSGSEQLWYFVPPFAPKDSVFALNSKQQTKVRKSGISQEMSNIKRKPNLKDAFPLSDKKIV